MTAHQDESVGGSTADLTGRLHYLVILQRMEAGDPHYAGAGAPYPSGCTRPKPEIGNRYVVATRQEGGRHIFKAERFDAEKRAETELFVARIRSEEKYVHRFTPSESTSELNCHIFKTSCSS
jgi:hypothetical protein